MLIFLLGCPQKEGGLTVDLFKISLRLSTQTVMGANYNQIKCDWNLFLLQSIKLFLFVNEVFRKRALRRGKTALYEMIERFTID
ncbi:hypothetical protein VISI1226_10982 [Vibrio sinaloensis DSM 21326]|uniref:Uncharacterized protein n=1 Tax=Vibrio sinaloensis DSM 21326 TaxID=945550 RepID=E8MB18_PHOS4|nr:hypothetical protein VISI1226_10982 [Vibrio sinaloensis DSM 21326]